ncbi:hypothetical protein ACTFIZ_004697 [Dictyostelium cf. discoideum]
MENTKENHLLNLKVMRLSKPNIPTINPILCEKQDLPYETMSTSIDSTSLSMGSVNSNDNNNNQLIGNNGNPINMEGLGVTSMLQLQSGVIYLGEMFCCYISLNNHSPYQVRNVFLKVELQTTSSRIPLLDSEQQSVPTFNPGFSSDFVVQREVKESGINILVCAVNYTTPEGEQKKFRKYFKFQVLNPLVLKTRIHNLPNVVFLEACLENATQGSLFIESILFEPIEHFNSKDISFENNLDNNNNNNNNLDNNNLDNNNNLNNNDNLEFKLNEKGLIENTDELLENIKITTSDNIVFLKQGCSRQYLFQITPKDIENVESKNSLPLGRLDITWRSYFGEIGRLKTAAIQRKLNQEDIECSLINIPDKIKLEKPFSVIAKLSNKSTRILYPQFMLVRNKMDGIKINSHLPKLDPIQPNSIIQVEIEMFPLKPGMQQIIGLAIKLLDPPVIGTIPITSSSSSSQQQNILKPTLGQVLQQQTQQQPQQQQQQQQTPKNLYEFNAVDTWIEFADSKLVDI